MKKFISIILTLILLLLTSCSNGYVTTEQTTETTETTETTDYAYSPVQPLFKTIEGLLAASRGEGEPDNVDAFESFEFPDFDKVVYPICNLEGYHLVNAKLWRWGYQYWFTTQDELIDITISVRMIGNEMPTAGAPLANGAYRNGDYIFVPYGDVYYSIYFSDGYIGEKTPDVVTMVSVDIP
ncbi:MAG: hypothetical protein J6D11_06695 [Clostridia bacterium]|nr:hypothetical protein [Clostridia bacterium]